MRRVPLRPSTEAEYRRPRRPVVPFRRTYDAGKCDTPGGWRKSCTPPAASGQVGALRVRHKGRHLSTHSRWHGMSHETGNVSPECHKRRPEGVLFTVAAASDSGRINVSRAWKARECMIILAAVTLRKRSQGAKGPLRFHDGSGTAGTTQGCRGHWQDRYLYAVAVTRTPHEGEDPDRRSQ
jgi:hypothetical protein